ncbi:DUF4139 domain-containing protein [Novosphingopyxis sp.]|uniref:DUF4139 domain-containing protein n=1 Tax=Novosphingopyxis sp. TaxID=2709690 RepID=UPI003B5B914D
MRHLCVAILLAAVNVPLWGQTVSDTPPPADRPTAGSAQGDVALTIYQNGQSLIQDQRQLRLPAGRSRQEFPDVSAQIRPETVVLSGPGIGIVEQNFDYDLLTPGALIQKAVGETVTLLRTNPATGAQTRERAKVLAANGGVVIEVDGHIEVLRDDGLPVRVIFDQVPPGLRARPTLSVTLESASGGMVPTNLSYLTPGIGWSADYVALFDQAAGTIDVEGWVTLTNNSGTSYRNAELLLVAGDPAGGAQPQYRRGRIYPPQPSSGGIVRAGTETGTRERLGDYILYPLERRTDVLDAQQKQVSFLDVQGSPARASYDFHVSGFDTQDPASASSVLKFSTSAQSGLGDQLPEGTVRVYMKDASGSPQFIGESEIDATPMGSDLSIVTGDAFDVNVRTVVEARDQRGDNHWRTTMRYELTNASARAITVELTQDGLYGEARVIEESLESDRVSADSVRWQVPVPANGSTTVSATFDTRY